MTLQLPPLTLYVHLPWCVRKCPYCDFNSHRAPSSIPEGAYTQALLDDLRTDCERIGERSIEAVFFGGGTPSLFTPRAIERFLLGAQDLVMFAKDVEITLEANPGAIDSDRFAGYCSAGVNRFSLGVQSFKDEHLSSLGRIHAVADVYRAVEALQRCGVENFNLDLMYGLPEQSLAEALTDVQAAIALQPAHISHYQLTLEPGTVFHARPPELPDDETAWAMQVMSQAALGEAGFEQYEVSAYARPGYRCRHNLNYWRFGDYLGVGAGAHGKLTELATGAVLRTTRTRQPREYLQRPASDRVERKCVPQSDLAFEFMLNAGRLNENVEVRQFENRTGLTRDHLRPGMEKAASKGLVEFLSPDAWRTTEQGRRFLNDLQGIFLPG